MAASDGARPALKDRVALADTVRRLKVKIAGHVTEEFLRRHPDWVERYGERARLRGIEDAEYHLDLLAGALEAGSPASFGTYASWAADVLEARGIERSFLAENLEQIRDALGSELTESEREAIARFFESSIAACESPEGAAALEPGASGAETDPRLRRTFEVYLQAILNGDRRAAVQVAAEAVQQGCELLDFYSSVLVPAQWELGRRWQQNRLSVAGEHAATAITQFVMAQIYSYAPVATEEPCGRMVVSGVRGERHQIGAHMVADVLEAEGWDVRFLGVDLPESPILSAVEAHAADTLAVSTKILFNLPAAVKLVQAARAMFGDSLRILVGGSAFDTAPWLPVEMGADAYAPGLRSAVSVTSAWRQQP